MTGRLFVSFWHLCLENLPESRFVHRRIAAAETRRLIDAARRNGRLLCVSQDDLLAPYKEREARQHERLCQALRDHCDLALSFEDFLAKSGEGGEAFHSITPLSCVQISDGDRLLVVTCSFTLPEGGLAVAGMTWPIAPDSIAFHLIEAARHEQREALPVGEPSKADLQAIARAEVPERHRDLDGELAGNPRPPGQGRGAGS